LKNQEAGNYYVHGRILYTKDTLQAGAEKAVEVVKLQNDSLQIKMNDDGKIRVLDLVRQKRRVY